jgi:acetylornithine deacetylase
MENNSSNIFDPAFLIKELIKIESISGNESKLVHYLENFLNENNIYFKREGNNIIISVCSPNFNENFDKTLLICSHIDTVPVCNGWTKDPFGAQIETISNDIKIFGLGANDALASVISILHSTISTYKEIISGQLKGRLIAAIVCEEEKGNLGFVRIEKDLPNYDYAIFGEPTTLKIGYCMRGSMKLKAFAFGKSCHASRPHEGLNASWELINLLTKLKNLPLKDNSPWGTATCEPVLIQGGTAENQIPDKITVTIDSRPTWEVNNEKILELLDKENISYEIIRNIRRAQSCPLDSPLIHAIKEIIPNSSTYAFGGSCDMAFSRAKDSIVFGPGSSERSHSADEYILLSELKAGCDSYEKIIRKVFSI